MTNARRPILALLATATLLSACGQAPAQAPRPRAAGALAARGAADAPVQAIAKAALGDYGKHLEAALRALQAKDQKAFTAAIEKLLKALVDALRGVSRSLAPGARGADQVALALQVYDQQKARYDAMPGDLSLDREGEKERLVAEMEQVLLATLLEFAGLPSVPESLAERVYR